MPRHLRIANLLVAPEGRTMTLEQPPIGAAAPARATAQATIAVQGLFCSICAARVQASLRALPGVQAATCSLATQQATVQFDPDRCDPGRLEQAVRDAALALPLRRLIAAAAGRSNGPFKGR